jgi:ribosome-binding factor A
MSRRSSSHHHHLPSKGPSQRQLRVAEEIRHLLAGIFMRGELRDPALAGVSITVTEVRISPDLKHATAYCVPLGGAHVPEVLAALNRSRSFLRGQIGHQMSLRHTPELHFAEDKSFDEAQRIEAILHSEKVRRDLRADDDGED